ncbi:hypothetical protein HYPBUDRAFT_153294 [Hyphopichia burtonii NRRL Y-1933]|uniref:Maintenance of telomere capping protein 6 n=1 Tax=Hyphopichia burtonii NRRL Y-1933 TaxID=984485 RepID=A0A1E4RGS2_9ASCO|nr:hypothetical protein HYPBUDRAFT_153294 [Hyphopichia burtonii NRRL Y-1933]ODV66459.1 hypothetical protein HYPBUDRAFT_153294 [Hyphopichia burtonii NRRL Y-1933]
MEMRAIILMRKLLLLALIAFNIPYAEADWLLSDQQEIAVRSQRDISRPIPIDQLTTFGVSLNRLVFENEGYNHEALSLVLMLLSLSIQTIMVDLYWNEFVEKWQLCPAPFPSNVTNNLLDTVDVIWKGGKYKCQPGLTTQHLMNVIEDYLSRTNTNMDVNIIQVLFNLKSISYEDIAKPKGNSSKKTGPDSSIYTSQPSDYLSLGNSSLNDTISPLSTYLYTPTNLKDFENTASQSEDENDSGDSNFYNSTDGTFPTLENFLFSNYKRTLAIVMNNELEKTNRTYNISSNDRKNIFFRDGKDISDFSSVFVSTQNQSVSDFCDSIMTDYASLDEFDDLALNQHSRFIVDDNDHEFTNDSFADYVRCGLSPILNSTKYDLSNTPGNYTSKLARTIDTFSDLVFWSWAVDQPRQPTDSSDYDSDEENDDKLYGYSDDGNSSIASNDTDNTNDPSDPRQRAYKCVAVFPDGWKLANCYGSYNYACKHKSSPNDWFINADRHKEYFEAYKKGTCPEEYSFGVPRLSIEMLSLLHYIDQKNISYPVWIDVNDVTVTDCFVSGGPYAECPYQKTITRLTLAKLVAPSFIVAVFILSLWFLEKFLRVNPVQTNRKRHWKRVINEYYKDHDYEGVPS